ncbi:MAG TPA: hypothetical protein VGK24_13995 [Candidatus Angelobacter sp.]|jgi:hypothetical protein
MPSCALCLKERELRQSHIVPAFVGRYLKETSATGFVRGVENPNLRVQDLKKIPLLCGECEQLFSRWEKEFNDSAFPIIQGDNYKDLRYDSWLLNFAVSLNWRVLLSLKHSLIKENPHFADKVEKTAEAWRQFLFGENKQPGSEHHLFVFSVPTRVPDAAHEKLLHYMLRSIDASAMLSNKRLGMYSKLLRSFFFSPIVPSSSTGWKNTRIHAGTGKLVSPQVISMPGFGDFINSRVAEAFAKPISENQQKKIADALLKNPERALGSESYKTHKASQQLFSGRDTEK